MSERIDCRACDIRCKHLAGIRAALVNNSTLSLPEEELFEGTSGYAKALIVNSLAGREVVAGDQREINYIQRSGPEIFKSSIEIPILPAGPGDREFMDYANNLLDKSNCWWRPTSCLFVRGGEVLVWGASRNQWGTDCDSIPLKREEIKLIPEERIDFCDAIHAETLAIANASQRGVQLKFSTLYVTTCPCEECSKVVVEAGVSRVVFESDYYNQAGLSLLAANKIKIARYEK